MSVIGAIVQTPVTEAILANFSEDRSGDIYVVFNLLGGGMPMGTR